MAETDPPSADHRDWASALAAHLRWLRTVVQARLFDSHAVDEVMQEVAVAVVRQVGQPMESGGATAWLYRVAVRQTLLYQRKMGREARRQENYAAKAQVLGSGNSPDPLEWLLADEESELVRQALMRLASRDRELLLLKYSQDWTTRQLAERLGLQPGTVDVRLHRARQRLRAELSRGRPEKEHG